MTSRPVEEVAREIVGECGHDRLSFPQPRCRACKTGKAIASALRAAVDAERAEASEMRAAMEPFAAYAIAALSGGLRENYVLDQIHGRTRVTLGDCIAARKALLPRGVDVDERKQGRDL
jgi:hypothetical protein